MDQIRLMGVSKEFSRAGRPSLMDFCFKGRMDRGSDRFWALQGIDLAISGRGARVGIVGANGSGKTTLLRIIAGVTQPTKGTVLVKGLVVPLLDLAAGMQSDLTGRENIDLNSVILGMRRREIREKFDSIVEFAELARFIDTPLRHYSAGMIVRLGFSIAIHVDADIFLLDETWSLGDAGFQAKSFQAIERLQAKGVTTVVVSHDLEILRQLSDETLWLEKGQVTAFGPTDSIVEAYQPLLLHGVPSTLAF